MQAESFIDFLAAYGKAHRPTLAYREGDDFAEWQRRFRQALAALMGPVPDRVGSRAEIVESVRAEGHTRHLLRIPVTRFSTLVAYLLVPDGVNDGEPRPGLIASHGHAKRGIDDICGVGGGEGHGCYGLHAVRSGYVVLAPAWWGWQGRDGHLDRVGGRDRCNVIQMAAGMYGMNVIALHVQDGQAAIDALAARPEVDGGRIGCMGNSYGGRTTMWLTVFDRRIRACVPAGCMNTFRERSLKLSSCGIQYPFGLLRHGDVAEVFSLIAPRPMQLQAGERDGLITPADRDVIAATVRRAYQLLDAEGNFDLAVQPGGHFLSWNQAEPFLANHLGPVCGPSDGP